MKQVASADLLDPYFRIWLMLTQTKEMIEKTREKELRPYGISASQSAILFVIKENEGEATLADIARWCVRAPHSISAIVNRMEKNGLLKKVRNPGKKRAQRIVLTKKGEEAYRNAMIRGSIHAIVSVLSEEQREQLGSCLKLLRQAAITKILSEYEAKMIPWF